jgi:hypothetical protein
MPCAAVHKVTGSAAPGRYLSPVRICHNSQFAANTNINAALDMHAYGSQAGRRLRARYHGQRRHVHDVVPGYANPPSCEATAFCRDRTLSGVSPALQGVLRCPFTPLVLMDYSSGDGARRRPSPLIARDTVPRCSAGCANERPAQRPHVVVSRHTVATLGSILETATRVRARRSIFHRCT